MNTPENSARGARDDAPRGEHGENDDRGGRGRRDDRDRGGTRGRNHRKKQEERGGGRGRQQGRRGGSRDDRDRGGRGAHQGGRDDRDRRGGKDRDARGDRDRRGGHRKDRENGGRDRRDHRDRSDDRDRGGRDRRDDRDRSGQGGRRRRDAVPGGRIRNEAQLSRAARDRLKALRTDYDPQDEDRHTDERDTYVDVPGGIRLQKALASAGIASRRASEDMIAAGRVSVDGQTVRRFGARVDPETSEIRVDDMRVVTAPDRLYFALNKPRGVVSTMWDPQGRPSLADYTGETTERIFHVGRLDTETEGLILLTNDGDLANRLTHPRYKVAKTYIAKVPGPVPQRVVRQLRKGIELDDGPVEVDSFRVVDNVEPRALVEIRLHEGRKHIVRRLMEAVDHPVSDLARTQIGPINLNTLKPGTMRALSSREVGELYAAAGL